MTAATPNALDFFLAVTRAQARLARRVDDDLGAFHGLSFEDFDLLYLLMRADDGRLPMNALARTLGISMTTLVRRMVLLEKTGLAQRLPGPATAKQRYAALRLGGRQLVQGAVATAEGHCKDAVGLIDASSLASAPTTLLEICVIWIHPHERVSEYSVNLALGLLHFSQQPGCPIKSRECSTINPRPAAP